MCVLADPAARAVLLDFLRQVAPNVSVHFAAAKDPSAWREALTELAQTRPRVDALLYLCSFEAPVGPPSLADVLLHLRDIAASKLRPAVIDVAAPFWDALDRCHLDALIGLARSLGLVLPGPRLRVRIMQAPPAGRGAVQALSALLPTLWRELCGSAESVLYQDGKRRELSTRSQRLPDTPPDRAGLTYLITGGCGGLGLLIAKHLARTAEGEQRPRFILLGRSPLGARQQAAIAELQALRCAATYVAADVCDASELRRGLASARAHFGAIQGVVHAAGVASSRSLLEKDEAELHRTLDPKIRGTLVLDQVLRNDPLVFVCYFSSTSAVLGDFGAGDYAVGNRFQLAYSQHRNELVARGERTGKTVAICWPLWREGGMKLGGSDTRAAEESERLYLKSSGQRLLETAEGCEIFDRALAGQGGQYLVLVGQPSRIHRFLRVSEPAEPVGAAVAAPPSQTVLRPELRGLSLSECVSWDLRAVLSKILRLPGDALEEDANLTDYGLDSIGFTRFAGELSRFFGFGITPALFFGHSSLTRLVMYFTTERTSELLAFYAPAQSEEAVPPEAPPAVPPLRMEAPAAAPAGGEDARNDREPIAIIGMSGRFPAARDIGEMWRVLAEGIETIEEVPAERFDWRRPAVDRAGGALPCRWGGFVPGVSEFDSLFFELTPREAELMDPRHRLLLQEAWNALEDAGYGPRQLATGPVGVFVGAEDGDYQFLSQERNVTANHTGILAARLSYFLNLGGPVMTVNTACSSALVAVHLACQSLRSGECETAIVAAANLMLTPHGYLAMNQAGMLSESGRCYAFDSRANGLVPGEAIAAVVLKRLTAARRDGDPIDAVVTGSGINYDGKTNGITAPSSVAQASLLKSIYTRCGVQPRDIDYIVTHGTGTKLGDPVEVQALRDCFHSLGGRADAGNPWCALSSTKTNFGHTFAAAGLVSLIGLVQALRHQIIPASLHCETPNEHIDWTGSPFFVNRTPRAWPHPTGTARPRRGAVSAFGMSGTNAHVLVESAPDQEPAVARGSQAAPHHLLLLSAKTEDALKERIRLLRAALQKKEVQRAGLAAVSYTLAEGRHPFQHRCALVVQDFEEALHACDRASRDGQARRPNVFWGKVPRGFSGQRGVREYIETLGSDARTQIQDAPRYRETLCALAELYCQGYAIPWCSEPGAARPQRLHLPSYPFARERHWVQPADPLASPLRTAASDHDATHLQSASAVSRSHHPFLHAPGVDATGPGFLASFTGEEPFLAHHVVQGKKTLPGMAQIEAARAAAAMTWGKGSRSPAERVRLTDIVFSKPLIAAEGSALCMQIRLTEPPPADAGVGLRYQIWGDSVDAHQGPGVRTLCGEGTVWRLDGGGVRAAEAPRLDLAQIKAACRGGVIDGARCYEMLAALGLGYGEYYRSVASILLGEDQVLARLELPAAASASSDRLDDGGDSAALALHPSLLDGALQASLGLVLGTAEEPSELAVPYALEELVMESPCTRTMWAHIRPGSAPGKPPARRLDVDLCDEQGRICVRIKGLLLQTLPSRGSRRDVPELAEVAPILMRPDWCHRPATPTGRAVHAAHVILLCGRDGFADPSISAALLAARVPGAECIDSDSADAAIEERFAADALRLLETLQRIMEERRGAARAALTDPLKSPQKSV